MSSVLKALDSDMSILGLINIALMKPQFLAAVITLEPWEEFKYYIIYFVVRVPDLYFLTYCLLPESEVSLQKTPAISSPLFTENIVPCVRMCLIIRYPILYEHSKKQ